MSNPVNRFSQLSVDARGNAEKVAAWIVSNVPSFNRTIPYEWTEAVYREAARWKVSVSTVAVALVIARKYGHNFATITIGVGRPLEKELEETTGTPQKTKYSLELLDGRYRRAEAVNDVAGMEAIVALALKLLWEYAKANAKARQNRSPDAVLEWQDINRAVNEATRRAEGLDSHFRTLTRQELTALRDAPQPGIEAVTYRIARQSVRRRGSRPRNAPPRGGRPAR
jgi:hypothetical protein